MFVYRVKVTEYGLSANGYTIDEYLKVEMYYANEQLARDTINDHIATT